MKKEYLINIAQFLDNDIVNGERLYDYLDWLYSESCGYELYLQPLIVRCLRGEGVDVSFKGKQKRDCDFFVEGESVELKMPRDSWKGEEFKKGLYEEAFLGHPKADSYLFVHKGKRYYKDAIDKAEEYHTISLAGEDWWLTWMKIH